MRPPLNGACERLQLAATQVLWHADRSMSRKLSPRTLFASAVVLILLALYCFSGAVMNGSFAVAAPPDPERFSRNAIFWFRASIASAGGAAACLVVGVLRGRRGPADPRQ